MQWAAPCAVIDSTPPLPPFVRVRHAGPLLELLHSALTIAAVAPASALSWVIPMKRIALFLITNIAVLAVLSIVMRILGVDQMLAANGQDPVALLIMAAIFGFGGAFISLAMSKWMAKRSMGVQVIESPRNPEEAWLVETVRRQADAAGIKMPEVGIFDSPDMNAFATGARKNAALVAVSTGLLRGMTKQEAEAVLGHEVSHVAMATW